MWRVEREWEDGRGGPGRGRRKSKEGMLKRNHHRPVRRRTRRKGRVDDLIRWDEAQRIRMLRIWTKTAAA